jgi:hypothetical protein
MFFEKAFHTKKLLKGVLLLSVFLFIAISTWAGAQSDTNSLTQLEYLDRGLVAAVTSEGVFLSWRLKGNEVSGNSNTGLTGSNFNIYRDGQLIATVTDSANYLDPAGTATASYYVCAVASGEEVDQSVAITPWSNSYYDLPIKKPADAVMPKGVLFPDGEVCTYSAIDMSVGDVDGDGQYEYFVKWEPSNSKDVSQRGYTGNTYLDCYELDGTLLYRIDLGLNIRSGAHYTQFMAYDFDGDGKAEMMMKTAPGTKIIRYNKDGSVLSENYITMPQEDIAAGFSHSDDYRLSAEGYYDHVVKMFMNWDKHPEVLSGRWPKTLEECFGIPVQYSYPLSLDDAKQLATYFIDVYALARSNKNLLRQFEGFIIDGPEYLTVFNGLTGAEMQTIKYKPGREDDGLMWGDYAMGRIEPGNRVDRFLAAVAYLDGQKPYAVFVRGYYTRSTMIAYSWDGKSLKENWFVDSGWVPMTNPFNDGPHGRDGLNPEFATITTQGVHTLVVADVDGDGCDEVVFGSATIDHNGKLMYSSMDIMPPASATPGQIARLGHGDAIHVADIDPYRPGLEIFMCHEGGTWAPYGSSMRDAATGQVIFGTYSGKDTGRSMIGDVDPTRPGLEAWANGFWQANGAPIPVTPPGTNANIKWAADMTTQIISGDRDATPVIQQWDYINNKSITVLTATDTRTNNYTKGNPSLVADVFGDWREELLLRTTDSSAIRIFLSTEITNHKLYSLIYDPKYRVDVARQNNCYNQPAYTSFYFGSDTDWTKVPVPKFWTPGVTRVLKNLMEQYEASHELTGPLAHQLKLSFDLALCQLEKGHTTPAVALMKVYLFRLEHLTKHDNISPAAKKNLSYHAKLLIEMWQNGVTRG